MATWMAFDYPKVMAFSDGKRIENGAVVVVALAITVLVTTELAILPPIFPVICFRNESFVVLVA